MSDEEYMNLAIEQAKKGVFPYGTIIVKDGKIIGEGYSGEIANDPTAHDTTTAIRKACNKLGTTDLSGATAYCSSEPCLLCFGVIWWSNIRRIVYGVSIKDTIEDGTASFMQGLNISIKDLNHMSSNDFEITGGVCKEEVAKLMRNWKQ